MAEKKFEDRPQILEGDIVRVMSADKKSSLCYFVYEEKEYGVMVYGGSTFINFEPIVAVYRFDGRDFKCIWESKEEEYLLRKFSNAVDTAREAAKKIDDALKALIAARDEINKTRMNKE